MTIVNGCNPLFEWAMLWLDVSLNPSWEFLQDSPIWDYFSCSRSQVKYLTTPTLYITSSQKNLLKLSPCFLLKLEGVIKSPEDWPTSAECPCFHWLASGVFMFPLAEAQSSPLPHESLNKQNSWKKQNSSPAKKMKTTPPFILFVCGTVLVIWAGVCLKSAISLEGFKKSVTKILLDVLIVKSTPRFWRMHALLARCSSRNSSLYLCENCIWRFGVEPQRT